MKLLGLRASADYKLKGYSGTLAPSAVWGPPDPVEPARMPMLSHVVPVRLSEVGLAIEDENTKISGRKLMEKGLSMKLAHSPQVVWIAYQRVEEA